MVCCVVVLLCSVYVLLDGGVMCLHKCTVSSAYLEHLAHIRRERSKDDTE